MTKINSILRFYLASLLLLLISFHSMSQSQEAFDLTLEMFHRCKEIKTLYFEMTKTERVGNDYLTESFKTKLQRDPFKVYSKKIEDGKNPELLFIEGENDNKALINPDGFPWFNLSMDPKGDFMRKNQHHTLYETGYSYALKILEHLFDKYGQEVVEMANMLESKTVNNVDCYVLEFNNPHFKYISYEVKEGEDVLSIALDNMLSEFMIVELNEDVDDYDDVKAGQNIKIPNDYCPRLVIAIDKERMVPISLKVYDYKSLFEQLEYNNVQINPVFSESQFTEDCEGCGF